MSMDELLSSYEADLGIDNTTSSQFLNFNDESSTAIAYEVNLFKQASEQNLEVALKKEQSLAQGEAIDMFMPTDNVLRAQSAIDD